MKIEKHINEQKLIDYILGNNSTKEQNQIQHHINNCTKCITNLEKWQRILTVKDGEKALPTPWAKEEVWKKMNAIDKKFSWTSRLGLGIGSLSLFSILILSVFLLKHTPEDPIHVTQNEDKQIELFVNKPDTQQLNIIPVSHEKPLNGNLWVNNLTEQMLLEVDGFTQLINQDYQLWIIYTDENVQGVIIPIQDGSARLFMENMDVNNFKHIKASVEPKGGSSFPTGPDAFIVEFNK